MMMMSRCDAVDKLLKAVQESTNWMLNVNSLVVHGKRNKKILRCGRKLGANYVPVPELHGFRCSRCFNV